MLMGFSIFLAASVAICVVPARSEAQIATSHVLTAVPLPPTPERFHHHKTLQAVYDSIADSTRLSLITHNGMYFLTIQRPRLTWSVAYPGRIPTATPREVCLEFRTQEPQAAGDDSLWIESAAQRFEVTSAGSHSVPGTQTSSHFMVFPLPTAALATALAGDTLVVSVGGVVQRLKRDQIEALRELLARVGAWPTPPKPTRGGA